MARFGVMHVFSMLLALFALSLAQDMEITVDTTTDTPLMLAASIGDVDALRAELAKGSNVDEHNALGFTAAHQAVIYTHVSALEELIRGGANLNVQENDGWTPLMFASVAGNWDLIVTLLNNNADPLIHNNKNYGAHALAYFNNHKEQSQYIAEVALRRAILASDLHSMMLMIQDGANVNLQTDQGATALIVAAHAGQAGVVRWLLAVPGIMPDFQERDGWTALMFASSLGHVEIVSQLLDYGVDLSIQTVQGQTALSLAKELGQSETARVLEERLQLIAEHRSQLEAMQRQQQEEADRAAANAAAAGTASQKTATVTTEDKPAEGSIIAEKKEPAKKSGLFW